MTNATSTTNATFQLVNGYDRQHKQPEMLTFRNPANVAEMISWCDSNSHIWFRSMKDDARQCKINGKVRTWKRDPQRCEIPAKYGMYEYGTFYASDINRILIPVAGDYNPTQL